MNKELSFIYLNGSGCNRVSGHTDENDRDRWGKCHHVATSGSGMQDASGVPRGCLGSPGEKIWIRRWLPSRRCSRCEKRVECPESRASMKYIEGCVLLLFSFRKGRKCRADASALQTSTTNCIRLFISVLDDRWLCIVRRINKLRLYRINK